jgi:hypothetical protein
LAFATFCAATVAVVEDAVFGDAVFGALELPHPAK